MDFWDKANAFSPPRQLYYFSHMSLYCTNQFKMIVRSEDYFVVNTNKSRVKRITRRQDEDMETYAAGEGDVEESDPWDLFQWP